MLLPCCSSWAGVNPPPWMHSEMGRVSQPRRQRECPSQQPPQCPPSTMVKGFVSLRHPQGSSGSCPAEALSALVPTIPSRPPLLLPTGVRRLHPLRLRVPGRAAGGTVSNCSLERILPHLSFQPERGSLLCAVSSSLSLLAPATQGSHVVISDAGRQTHGSGQHN